MNYFFEYYSTFIYSHKMNLNFHYDLNHVSYKVEVWTENAGDKKISITRKNNRKSGFRREKIIQSKENKLFLKVYFDKQNNYKKVEKESLNIANYIAACISYEYNVSIGPLILNETYLDGKITSSSDLEAFLIIPLNMNSHKIYTRISEFSDTLKSSFLDIYRLAYQQKDPIGRYILLYSLLDIILQESNSGQSFSQVKKDAVIEQIEKAKGFTVDWIKPTLEAKINRTEAETKYTWIRNQIGHVQVQSDSSLSEICNDFIPRLSMIIKEVLEMNEHSKTSLVEGAKDYYNNFKEKFWEESKESFERTMFNSRM